MLADHMDRDNLPSVDDRRAWRHIPVRAALQKDELRESAAREEVLRRTATKVLVSCSA